MSGFRQVLVLGLGLTGLGFGSVAQAQSGPVRDESLYLAPQALMGPNQVVGLGGAYVAIAEGATGFTSNLAALAQRAPDNDRGWDVGFALSWMTVHEEHPSTQFLVGLSLQYQRFGAGTFLRSRVESFCIDGGDRCADDERVTARVQHAELGAAMGLGREDLILGIAWYVAQASFTYRNEPFSYSGHGFEIGALYRPHGQPFRFGLSLRPEVRGAFVPNATQSPTLAGREPFSAVVSPGAMSLGWAMRFGEGAEHFNRLSPAARDDLRRRYGEDGVPTSELPNDAPMGRLLVTAQLDLLAPTRNSVPLSSVVAEGDAPLNRVGETLRLGPRVGVEHETILHRLRLRAGGYLEPAWFSDRSALYPHATGGAELKVLHYFDDWAVSTSFDVSAHSYAWGLSVGVWR